jgi:hypothetical protein
MKKILIGAFLLATSGMAILGCDSDDPTIGRTAGQEIAGEWWVTYSVDGVDVNRGYSEIITSNTAANVNTEMLISDLVNPNAAGGNFWTYKIKAQIDPTAKKFTADEAPNAIGDEIEVNIVNGQIFPEGGFSKTRVVTDSIYFEIEFSDDPGTIYVAHGHKRTGFTEDDF